MIGDSDGYDDYDGYYDGSDRWREDDEYGNGDLGDKRSMIGMMMAMVVLMMMLISMMMVLLLLS